MLACRRWRQEGYEFRVNLSTMRSAWATRSGNKSKVSTEPRKAILHLVATEVTLPHP